MRIPLTLVLLASMSFAATGMAGMTGYYPMVFGGAILAASIVGIAFMASQFLQNPSLEAWARSEAKEYMIALATVVIVSVAVSASANAIVGSITGYSDQSTLISGITAKYATIEGDLTDDYEEIIRVTNRLGELTSYSYTKTLSAFVVAFGTSSAPFLGGSGLMQSLTVLAGSVSNGILIYEAMVLFLRFFYNSSIDFLLPVAFVFRLIPFTRRIGGTLIALALSGIFIYPFSMVLAATLHDNIGVEHSLITDAELDAMTLKLPNTLTELCTNDYIRTFTALNELGWWALICPAYCAITWASYCASAGPYWAACFWPSFEYCVMPISGYCYMTVSLYYQLVQFGLMMASTAVLVSASKSIALTSTDAAAIFDTVMNHLIIPVSHAATVPIMEAVLVGALTITGAKGLSAALGGDMAIVGLERML